MFQTSPSLSERAPPEGQEDPPLHQSIISLTPNNNNDTDDDNKNNNDSDGGSTGTSKASAIAQDVGEKRRLDIIGGVRWEELTKIGCEMIGEGGIDEEELHQEVVSTGARPKQRLGCEFSNVEALIQRGVSDTCAAKSRVRAKQEKRKTKSHAERKRLYTESFRKERRLPSLYIPVEVDVSKYKEEVSGLFFF